MMLRFAMAAGLAVTLVGGTPASAATPKQKMETCKFGADDQKLQGAARKKFTGELHGQPRLAARQAGRRAAAVVQPPDYRAGSP